MAANYYCILFDLDGTLLDFSAAEKIAIAGTLEMFGLSGSDENCSLFSEINASLWAQLEQGQIKKDRLLVQRFSQLIERLSAGGDAIRMNNEFMTRLSAAAMPFEGAQEVLAELAEFATLTLASNGMQAIQMSRLERSGLAPYFDEVFISEKVGATKPNPRFFETVLRRLGIQNREKVLMVGDSLTADIKGGIDAGIDTCWCDFSRAGNDTGIVPTYTIHSLEQLKLHAVGEEELRRADLREKRHTS